jgi:EAL domain-containing protein (putative c-di-GMP-specific phosphodiesterase class I)
MAGPADEPENDSVRQPDRFLQQMDRELSGWADPVGRLRQALAQDELVLFAQPIVSLREPDRYAMAEALVRLREEEVALLAPGAFLPVFEHFGMMPALDRWVLGRVATALSDGSSVPSYGINISVQTLADQEFAADVLNVLERGNLPSESLMFEVGESDLLTQQEAAMRFAVAVKALGCKLLIDGFGRRSVTFEPLKTLRVDFVKVDGVITRKLASSEAARSKLRAIARVGEAIGFAVIAEFVEDPEVVSILKEAGAGFAQGFGICGSAPIETFG